MKLLEHPLWRSRRLWMLLVLAAAVGALWWWGGSDVFHRIGEWFKTMPAWILYPAFFLLPIFGSPITWLLLIAGLRLGLPGGMVMAAGGICFHHLVIHRICRGRFRDRIRMMVESKGKKLPEIHASNRVWFVMLAAAVPGPPYALKLYLVALTGVPLRIYFWCGVPIYATFCLLSVGVGSAAFAANPAWIYGIVALAIGLVFLSRWLKKRFAGN